MTAPEAIRNDGIAPLAPSTPEEWQKVLARRMDLRRLGVLMLKAYMDGNAPLPEMTNETREAWMHFQRRARTNWGELIVDSVVDRIIPQGLTIGGDNRGPKAKAAQMIWRDNRMNSVFKQWMRYGLTFGQSYLTTWKGDNGDGPIISADSPETMVVITDPIQHWKPVAAMKVWRNIELAQDFSIVWTPKGWQQFTRPTYTKIEEKIIPTKWLINLAEGAWTPEGQPGMISSAITPIPVTIYNNPGGHGDYETHLDLINRINAGILERLVVAGMQAFRQRAITGGQLPELDERGNRIDWARVFAPAPGALWNLPEGLELWESQMADIGGLLNASKEDIRQLSAVTRTPLPMLMPDNTNTSAEGAKATEIGHYFRCVDRLNEAKFGIESCMDMATRLGGTDLADGEYVDVNFVDVDKITTQEKYQAALAAHNAGESWKSIQRNVLGYSPDQIEQDEIDRAHEALMAQVYPPQPTSVVERLEGQPPTPQEQTATPQGGNPVSPARPPAQPPRGAQRGVQGQQQPPQNTPPPPPKQRALARR